MICCCFSSHHCTPLAPSRSEPFTTCKLCNARTPQIQRNHCRTEAARSKTRQYDIEFHTQTPLPFRGTMLSFQRGYHTPHPLSWKQEDTRSTTQIVSRAHAPAASEAASSSPGVGKHTRTILAASAMSRRDSANMAGREIKPNLLAAVVAMERSTLKRLDGLALMQS